MSVARLLFSNLRRTNSCPLVIARSSAYVIHRCPSFSPEFTSSEGLAWPYSGNSVLSLCSSFHRRTFSAAPHDSADEELFPDSAELVSLVLGATDQHVFAGQDSILPVRVLISLIDGVHDLTGWPWWVVIASSTLTMRLLLFPFLVLQLRKLKTISEHLPQLPSPVPSLMSGQSYFSQFSLSLKEMRARGCPSLLWIFANAFVQLPLFFCWLTSVRRMCLDHHHGFDFGGALWFQNLSEFSNGSFGLLFPLYIGFSHYTIVQLSFDKSRQQAMTGIFGTLAKWFKLYLNLWTLPIILVSMNVPQGSQIYWVTNSSLTILQQWSLKQPAVRAILGLSENKSQTDANVFPTVPVESQNGPTTIRADHLSPKQLYQMALHIMPTGNREAAISLLQCAIEKDPNHVDAIIYLGQALLQEGYPVESAKLLENAASKLAADNPATLFHRILAYSWAGVAYLQQGKKSEGIAHLQRVVSYGEPDDHNSKMHFFDAVFMLAAALNDVGQQAEAVKYLNSAAVYNPAYKDLFERCTKDDTDLVSALISSRRRDY